MAILTHGSDLSLAPTIGPILRDTHAGYGKQPLADACQGLASLGFRSIHLDATPPGLRPRELDRRARKDLAATVARRGLRISGVDLFVPRTHFLDPDQIDRAVTATLAAAQLASDLGRIPLCVALPIGDDDLPADAVDTIVQATDARGIHLTVHAEDTPDALLAWLDTLDLPTLHAGIDPAAIMSQPRDNSHHPSRQSPDPAAEIGRFAKRLGVARISDHKPNTAAETAPRCLPGEGSLDLATARVAIDLAPSRVGPVVLDLRGITPTHANSATLLNAAARAKAAWEACAF